jgi:hypothetical protein
VLFYLGPELIAALLGACEGTRENSQASCGLSRPSVDERDVTPSPASPSSLPCVPTSTVAVSVTIRLFLDQVCSGVRIHETDALS